MPYSVTYDTETDCIYVSVQGKLNLSLLDSIAAEVARCIVEHGCRRILNDLRQATPTASVSDIYNMPKHALAAGVDRAVKRALLINEPFSTFRFLETVFINQGNIVQLFNNVDDAKRWLFDEKANS